MLPRNASQRKSSYSSVCSLSGQRNNRSKRVFRADGQLTDVGSAKVPVVDVVGVLPHVANKEGEARPFRDGVGGVVCVENLPLW